MRLAILQPTLIPNLYDLTAMLAADKVVLQDSEKWSRKGRTHRAKIRTPEGTQWLNVPVRTEDRKKQIRDVRIDHNEDWIEQVLRSIEYNYRNSVYYDFYEPEIRSDWQSAKQYEFLMPFVLSMRDRIFEYLEIEIPSKVLLSSEMPGYHSDPDRLAEEMEVKEYYQEQDAQHYQRQGKNKTALPFTHPVYRQHFEGFEPDCCLLDLLFQYGPESFKVIEEL
ncbi:MAG: WbqC family protein [Balneolaceae bacterium]